MTSMIGGCENAWSTGASFCIWTETEVNRACIDFFLTKYRKRLQESRSFKSTGTVSAESDSKQPSTPEKCASPRYDFAEDWDSEGEDRERVITRRRSFGDIDAEEARRGHSSPPSTPMGGTSRSRLKLRGSFTEPRAARARDTSTMASTLSRPSIASKNDLGKPSPSSKKEKKAVEAWPKLFSAKRVMRIARCLADAMRYMHSLDVNQQILIYS